MPPLRLSPLVVALTCYGGSALANQPPLAAQLAGNGLASEPMLIPDHNAAIRRAKDTLAAAHKLFVASAEGQSVDRVGFLPERLHFGAPSFRNELAVYTPRPDGSKTHIAYAMEMNVGRDPNVWTPIVLNRRGRINNRLFLGPSSVFALGGGPLPAELVQRIGEADLSSAAPLDKVAGWLVRRQTNTFVQAKPARMAAPRIPGFTTKPSLPAVASAPPPTSKAWTPLATWARRMIGRASGKTK